MELTFTPRHCFVDKLDLKDFISWSYGWIDDRPVYDSDVLLLAAKHEVLVSAGGFI